MVPAPSNVRRRAVLATAGAGLSGLAGCNFGYLGEASPERPPLWGESIPVYSGATTYDAIKLYRQAVERIVEADDTELPSREAIVDALEDVTFSDGLLYDEFAFTGPDADLAHEHAWESLAESGDPIVQQWQADGDGERMAVAPPDSRSAAYRPGPWQG